MGSDGFEKQNVNPEMTGRPIGNPAETILAK